MISETTLIIVVIIGGMFSLFGSIGLTILNNKETKDLKISTEKIDSTAKDIQIKSALINDNTNQLGKTTNNIFQATNSILEAQENIEKLNKSILGFNNEIKQLTSGLARSTTLEFEKNSLTGTLDGFEINPNLPLKFTDGSNQYIIRGSTSNPFQISNGINFSLQIKDNKAFISTTIIDHTGNVIIDIIDNKWLASNNILHKNYDSHGLEILDNLNQPILSVDLKDNILKVKGIFFSKSHAIILSDQGMAILPKASPTFLTSYFEAVKKITPIFLHHGKDTHGKRITINK